MHDGTTKNGELVLREDGTLTGCGGEGTWEIGNERYSIKATFNEVTHRIKFNSEVTEGILIEPIRSPATKCVKSNEAIEVDAGSSLVSAPS